MSNSNIIVNDMEFSRAITFTFQLKPFLKAWNHLSPIYVLNSTNTVLLRS